MDDVVDGRYRIEAELGSGGMGKVYRVQHLGMAKALALKVLRPEFSGVPDIAQRFEREARSAARLDDPHIVRVTDFGTTVDGHCYLVMELVEGISLAAKNRELGPFPVDLALDVTDQVLAALEHAHSNEVVHRDLKPDNIMLVPRGDRFLVKILDFGLAKLTDQDQDHERPLTQVGLVFGTPRYMSPEQASGESADRRSDLYAVGVLLYEMLAGQPPFDGLKTAEILLAHLLKPVPALELPGVDPTRAEALNRLLVTALAKHREERFENATAFRAALATCRDAGEHLVGASASPPPTWVSWTSFAPASLPSRLGLAASASAGSQGSTTSTRTRFLAPPLIGWLTRQPGRAAAVAVLALVTLATALAILTRAPPQAELQSVLEQALDASDLPKARELLDELKAEAPETPVAHLMAGHVAFLAGDHDSAVESYGVALTADGAFAGQPRFEANLRELLRSQSGAGYTLLRWVDKTAYASAAPLLAELASTHPHSRIRRRAYFGLKRLERLDLIDAPAILLADLKQVSDDACELRKWYIEQLIELPFAPEDLRLLSALRREAGRTGGWKVGGKANVNRCFGDLLSREIRARDARTESGRPR